MNGGAPSTACTRFIVLSGPRTGSHMVAQALNSHPQIVCFREVFNLRLDSIEYGVEGYDAYDAKDIALRKAEPLRFLDEKIWCEKPSEVLAVGFKFHYRDNWDAPGVLGRLTDDKDVRVVHLRRRNVVRALVSLKLAERTGVWLQEGRSKVTRKNLLRAMRHPARAWRRVARLLARPHGASTLATGRPPRARVRVSPKECYEYIVKTSIILANFEKRFEEHPTFALDYEDVLEEFLGVPVAQLLVTMRRQNPEPLSDLIENYDELYAAFQDSEYAELFDGGVAAGAA